MRKLRLFPVLLLPLLMAFPCAEEPAITMILPCSAVATDPVGDARLDTTDLEVIELEYDPAVGDLHATFDTVAPFPTAVDRADYSNALTINGQDGALQLQGGLLGYTGSTPSAWFGVTDSDGTTYVPCSAMVDPSDPTRVTITATIGRLDPAVLAWNASAVIVDIRGSTASNDEATVGPVTCP